jgi:hypothetical protein
MRRVKSVPFIQAARRIYLHDRKDDGLPLSPRSFGYSVEHLCADAEPLPQRSHVKLAERDHPFVALRLQPTDIAAIHDDDLDLIELELLCELHVFLRLIPANRRSLIQRMVS